VLNTNHIRSLSLEIHLYLSSQATLLNDELKILDFDLRKPDSVRTPSDVSMEDALVAFSGKLEYLKDKECSEDSLEAELEKHEKESTTSGYSRVSQCMTASNSNMGETDAQSVGYPTLDFIDSEKIMPYIPSLEENEIDLPQEIKEYYDGCCFGDLEIEFGITDRFLYEEDIGIPNMPTGFLGGYNYYGSYPYNPYNNYKPSPYTSPPFGGRTVYKQKRHEGTPKQHNDGYQGTYEPKKSSQPDPNFNIIPIPLFTLPTHIGSNPLNLNPYNSGTPSVQGQIEPSNTKQMNHYFALPALKTPQNTIKDKFYPHKNSRNKVHELHVASDQKGKKLATDIPSSPSHSQKKEKIHKKRYSATETKNRKSTKDHDKGEFKLWDMISIKGRLAGVEGSGKKKNKIDF